MVATSDRFKTIFGRAMDLRLSYAAEADERSRIRDLMNGGANALKALLGDKVVMPAGLDMPVGNIIDAGMSRTAQQLGRAPDLKVDPPPRARDGSVRGQAHADKRHRIVTAWDQASRIELQLPQIARWMIGYGFGVWTLRTRLDANSNPYPDQQLRNPFDVALGQLGAEQQPSEMAVFRSVPRDVLVELYPSKASALPERATGAGLWSAVATSPQGQWEGTRGGHEVIEYYDRTGTWTIIPELQVDGVVDFTPNPLRSGPAFVVPKRFSFDRLLGQYAHAIGLVAMMAKMNILALIAAQDSVFAPLHVIGDIQHKEYRRGRGAINYFTPGSSVARDQTRIPPEVARFIDSLERQIRIVGNHGVQEDSISPNSFVTGQGLERLGAAKQFDIREYQTSLRHALEILDARRLEWDESLYPNLRRPIVGQVRGAPFAEEYTPATDIAGNYHTRRVYGAMANFDEPSKIVAGLQLLQGDVIDLKTFREQIDGLQQLAEIDEGVITERIGGRLEEMLATKAIDPSMPPEERARAELALVEMFLKPASRRDTLTKFFTPAEPQTSPAEDEFLGQAAPSPVADLVGGPMPSVATVLSRLESSGGAEGGVQTVGRL